MKKLMLIIFSAVLISTIILWKLYGQTPSEDAGVKSVIEQYFIASAQTDWVAARKLLTGAQAKIFTANTQGAKQIQPCNVQLIDTAILSKNKANCLAICQTSIVLSTNEWSSREDYQVVLRKSDDSWRILEIKPVVIKDNLSDQGKMPDGLEDMLKLYLTNAAAGNWSALYPVLTSPALQEAKQTAALVARLPCTGQVENIKLKPVLANNQTAWITVNYDLGINGQFRQQELLIKLRTVNGSWKVYEVIQN